MGRLTKTTPNALKPPPNPPETKIKLVSFPILKLNHISPTLTKLHKTRVNKICQFKTATMRQLYPLECCGKTTQIVKFLVNIR